MPLDKITDSDQALYITRLRIGFIAITGNYMVLRIFGRFDSLRTPANILIMNLAVSDFLVMVNLLPEATYSFLTGGLGNLEKWPVRFTPSPVDD